jgi:TonB family protein
MPSTLIRLAVALVAFGLGVSATMLWIAYRTPDVKRLEAAMRLAHPLPPLPTGLSSRPLISGGLINHKTLSKPAPTYPSAAVASNASGTVAVRVLVDETGRVVGARPLSGNRLLQEAAVDAAFQARFAPTRLEGQWVRVSGTLTYKFVLP